MWAGNMVHECIRKAIENIQGDIEPMSIQESIDKTLAIMRQEFKDSKRGRYWREPKSCALYEHEYELMLPDSEWKNNADHVVKCLQTFFNSDVYRQVCQLSKEQWLEVEKFSSFQYDNIKIYVVPDFAFQDGEEIVIYDWKTGKEEADNHKLQLACYGLYAIQQWSVKSEQIRMVEFYLSSGKQNEHNMTDFELDPIHQYIGTSIEAMKDLLDDPQANIASEDQFPFTENEQICQFCNYYKVCPRWS